MATYNGEKFLRKQLDSIFSQTYTHFCLYVFDDHSDDNTLDILKEYKKYYPNLKFVENSYNRGYVKNFEEALRYVQESYIFLSDQDDIWEKDKLQLQLSQLLQVEKKFPNVPIMIHSDLSVIDGEEKIIFSSYFKKRNYNLKSTKDLGHIVGPCGVMGNTIGMNKILKEKILPFPQTLDNHDYWIALVNEVCGIRITFNRTLVQYRIHLSNSSNNITTFNKSIFSLKMGSLPYINSNRKQTIQYLLENYQLKKNDERLLKHFCDYLDRKSLLSRVYYPIRYSFIKRAILYRVKFFLKSLLNL